MKAQEDTQQDGTATARALEALKLARQRLEDVANSKREPIAIVGIGCRFPTEADTPQKLWNGLRSGADGIRTTPESRWNEDDFKEADGQSGLIAHGGFIDNVEQFDNTFFNMSPREARQLDPQQRVLLEVTVDALRDASYSPTTLAGSRTGVYVGVVNDDYLQLQLRDPKSVDIYSVIGGVHCMLANRLSYELDLQGPSMAVDTACSGSLVALHLACQSLRSGESDVALSAGVNLILSPFTTFAYTRAFPLAADGRCKTFDANADGYVRGEGCGVVVLKRLSDALRDQDTIYATVRGSAVNQDGRTNGLTAPNGLAQERVVKRALDNADLNPEQITYLEAHGTGTQLGDPIEVEALRSVYSSTASQGAPCGLGSIKTNIGHLEAASGIAGVIKLALCLSNREIPPHLHLREVNPEIPLDGSRFFIPNRLTPWGHPNEVLRGAVSAFGAGGTNAHALLESAPKTPQPNPSEPGPYTLLLSARCKNALQQGASTWAAQLAQDPTRTYDACATSTLRQEHDPYRLAVTASGHDALVHTLEQYSQGDVDCDGTCFGVARSRPRVAFVFSGFGGQWPNMATELIATQPLFDQALSRCEQAIAPYVHWSLREELADIGPHSSIACAKANVVQPILWCIQVALAELWKSWGIQPDAVIGHSMGELAAAVVAGSLTHDDAAKVICIRSHLVTTLEGKGAMLLVSDTAENAKKNLGKLCAPLFIAASNSPRSTVLSGPADALAELKTIYDRQNVFTRELSTTYAAHSPMVAPLIPELRRGLGSIIAKPPQIAFVSTVDIQVIQDDRMHGAYWERHLSHRVHFAEAIHLLLERGYDTFVEIGPHPILLNQVRENAESCDKSVFTLATLSRGGSATFDAQRSLGELAVAGCDVDWKMLYDAPFQPVRLPPYPWQRRSFWFQSSTRYQASQSDQTSPEPSSTGRSLNSPSQLDSTSEAPTFSLLRNLEGSSSHRRNEIIFDFVRHAVATALGYDEDSIDADGGFFQLGMNSIMVVQLRQRLANASGLTIPTAAIFEHATIGELATYLDTRLPQHMQNGQPEPAESSATEHQGLLHSLPNPDDLDALSDGELLESLERELTATTPSAP